MGWWREVKRLEARYGVSPLTLGTSILAVFVVALLLSLRRPRARPVSPARAAESPKVLEGPLRIRALDTKSPTVLLCIDAIPSSELGLLKELSALTKLVLVSMNKSCEDTLELIRKNQGFSEQLPPHRVLFCDTRAGKISILRQLDALMYIDADGESASQASKYVKLGLQYGSELVPSLAMLLS